MAAPMSPPTLLAVTRSSGQPVSTWIGYETRKRNSGGPFAAHCVRVHCTGGGDNADPATYIRNVMLGDVVSFKSQFFIDKTGRIWILGAGRANDISLAGSRSYNALMNGTWPIKPGWCDWRGSGAPNPGAIGYGIECLGLHLNAAQVEAAARLCAAICKHYGWTAGSVAGHGEIASDRAYADPGIDTGKLRVRIQTLIGSSTPPPTIPPAGGGGTGGTPTPQEDDVPEQTAWRSNATDQKIPGGKWVRVQIDKDQASLISEGQGAMRAICDWELAFSGGTPENRITVQTYIWDVPTNKEVSAGYQHQWRYTDHQVFQTIESIGVKNRRVYLRIHSDTPITITQSGGRALYWKA